MPNCDEFVAIGAERVGFDELRAGFDVGLMDVEHRFGVRGVEFVHAALRADGFVEQRAHGAIAYQDGVLQPLVEVFDSHASALALSFAFERRSAGSGGLQKVHNYTIGVADAQCAGVGAQYFRRGPLKVCYLVGAKRFQKRMRGGGMSPVSQMIVKLLLPLGIGLACWLRLRLSSYPHESRAGRVCSCRRRRISRRMRA